MLCSPLSAAFDDLQQELLSLDAEWTSELERASLRHTAGDIRHHVCALLGFLWDEMPHYDELDGERKLLAHEAFLSVLALGQLLLRAIEDNLAPHIAIARAQIVTERLLDLFVPMISRADVALRRVLLDEVPIETALAEMAGA